jgi:hypothetical protein
MFAVFPDRVNGPLRGVPFTLVAAVDPNRPSTNGSFAGSKLTTILLVTQHQVPPIRDRSSSTLSSCELDFDMVF